MIIGSLLMLRNFLLFSSDLGVFFISLCILFVDTKWDIDYYIKVQTYSYYYEFFGVCLFFFLAPSRFSVSFIFYLATKNVAKVWNFLDFVRVEIIQCC